MRSSRRTAGWRITEGLGAALAHLGALAQLALPGLAPCLTRSLAAPGLALGERTSPHPLPEEPQRLGRHRGSPAPLSGSKRAWGLECWLLGSGLTIMSITPSAREATVPGEHVLLQGLPQGACWDEHPEPHPSLCLELFPPPSTSCLARVVSSSQ